ncbi:MAG TPA: hypothetical protein PLH43_01475 [Acetivibrio sp.]|uniref:hypothetical protein n=1 Tax=Acetivibrio sp. TaxID=1872092 RepID=UPI002CC2412B|nr:hypothetical protein [Acetivibrio sp.]HOM01485.1 hypothetical protein [Acetivibrio sp.]
MNKYEKLEAITNGINAANKIRTLQSSATNERADAIANIDQVGLISQMLDIIAQYSPNTHRKRLLNENLNKTRMYSQVYKGLKHEMKDIKSSNRVGKKDIINTLHILQPVVDNRSRTLIEKILKIQEILDS